MSRILFVNKFSPLSNAVTGKMADELANYLIDQGHKIEFISIRAKYRAKKSSETAYIHYPIHQLREWYSGDRAALRLIFSLIDGLRMFFKSCFIKKDVVIVMTEPPLLFFWFQLFRWLTSVRLIYWTMDVYPEAFVSGKFISADNFIYRMIRSVVYHKPPDLLIALGREQQKYLAAKFKREVRSIILPCGLLLYQGIPSASLNTGNRILFGYSGNLGAAHDPDFLLSLIRQLDPAKHAILLSLYGTKAEAFKKQLEENAAVLWKEVVTYDEIAAIDINIASLLPEWNHVSVPSKAVTAICCGSTLLLNMTEETDNWKMFEHASWRIDPTEDYDKAISSFLAGLTIEDIHTRSNLAKQIAAQCLTEVQAEYSGLNAFLNSITSRN